MRSSLNSKMTAMCEIAFEQFYWFLACSGHYPCLVFVVTMNSQVPKEQGVSWTSELPSDQRVPVLTDGRIPILSFTVCFTCSCVSLLYLLKPF
jgi:hypothetical protein